jgi:hypothetical protein
MPQRSMYINLKDYLKILGRMLAGKPDYYPNPDSSPV